MQSLLIESSLRAILIAAVIGLVLFAMRIKTASVLHAVWAGVVVLMMLLPAWVAWGPRASIPILAPQVTGNVAQVNIVPPASPAGLTEAPSSPVREDGGSASLGPIAVIYLLGVGVLLLRLAIGAVRASRLKSCVTPITVGLLRLRIILPESSRDWSQAQLDAVLAHEGEHVRRRDPLFQWIALLNRAIFWFHPLAWWLERRLSGLAEEVCDAAVLAQGHDPREYSEYLLSLARSVERAGSRVKAVGMAMPGAFLPQRIKRILSGVPIPRISRSRVACTMAMCAAAAAVLAASTLVRAQTPLAFEVASIRQTDGNRNWARTAALNGKFVADGATLKMLIEYAFRVQAFQVSGGPDWVASFPDYTYDIQAKPESQANEEQIRRMVQSLLADRFKLKLHHVTRESPGYLLSLAKSGPKFKEAPASDAPYGLTSTNPLTGKKMSIAGLAEYLSGFVLNQPVIDQTGLKGLYDFTVKWTPDPTQFRGRGGVGFYAGDPNGPDIGTAFQEQLGLKLEPRKIPTDYIVIDQAEKPSEN